MSQTTFLSDVLGGESIPKGKLAYFQARLSNVLHEAVLKRFVELERETGFTRADLARRIGRKPEQVTRWLGSPGNWTLETVSDLLTGMGCELSPSIVAFGTHQDPQALTYANALAAQVQTCRYAVINAINQPVTATFNRGQTVYIASVATEPDTHYEADHLLYEPHPAMLTWSGRAPNLRALPGHERERFDVPALVELSFDAAAEVAQQNPLPTDNLGQTKLRGSRS